MGVSCNLWHLTFSFPAVAQFLCPQTAKEWFCVGKSFHLSIFDFPIAGLLFNLEKGYFWHPVTVCLPDWLDKEIVVCRILLYWQMNWFAGFTHPLIQIDAMNRIWRAAINNKVPKYTCEWRTYFIPSFFLLATHHATNILFQGHKRVAGWLSVCFSVELWLLWCKVLDFMFKAANGLKFTRTFNSWCFRIWTDRQ